MADTQRTLTDLLTNLFQDGQVSEISANDIRDLIVSLSPGFGRCGMQGNATVTTIAVAGTFVKVSGVTAMSGMEVNFDDGGASNRLRYIGAAMRHVHIAASFDVQMGANNQIGAYKIWHWDDSAGSGSYLESSKMRRKVSTGSDIGAVALHGDVEMDTNDYIEIHATNETSTSSVTLESLYLFAMTMIV